MPHAKKGLTLSRRRNSPYGLSMCGRRGKEQSNMPHGVERRTMLFSGKALTPVFLFHLRPIMHVAGSRNSGAVLKRPFFAAKRGAPWLPSVVGEKKKPESHPVFCTMQSGHGAKRGERECRRRRSRKYYMADSLPFALFIRSLAKMRNSRPRKKRTGFGGRTFKGLQSSVILARRAQNITLLPQSTDMGTHRRRGLNVSGISPTLRFSCFSLLLACAHG